MRTSVWTKTLGRVPRFVLLLSLIAVVAAACGGDDPTATPTRAQPTATPVPTATPRPGTTVAPIPTATPRPAATATPTTEPVSFDGKILRFNVGYSPGGSFDLGARFMAKHIADRLPGTPRRVLVSSLPGAGSLTAARKILTTEPRDDEPEVVIFIASILLRSVLGGVEGFNPGDAAFLGVPDLVSIVDS